jgi:hypothetical protein
MMYRAILAALPIALSVTVTGASASSYQELFPNPDGLDQQQQLRNVGWCGGNAGDPFCENRPGDTNPDTDNDGGEGAVSVGNGQDGAPGFLFWSQKGINADKYVYTEEFGWQTALFESLSWWQRDSSDVEGTRLMFEIDDGDWYVSKEFWNSTNDDAWEQKTVTDLSALSFVNYGAVAGGLLPGGDVETGSAVALPDGAVTAWGFSWNKALEGNKRIDSVELHTSPIPLPPAAALMLAGLGGLGVIRARRAT